MNIQYFWYLKVIWQQFEKTFKWISYTRNRKWRERKEDKNVNFVYGRGGGGGGGGEFWVTLSS